ncbi:MAG: flavodoxin [Clostridia bacterium]|nr:flavodoxin [Clostridia bacterium]
MTYAVRYYTRSGNTEKLADAIAIALKTQSLQVSVPLEEKVDVLFLGCSYYAFDVDEAVKAFVHENQDKIGSIVCFGTSAMMKSMQKPMSKVVEGTSIVLSNREFHCRGAFGPMHKNRPDEKDRKAAADFAKSVIG